MSLQSHEDAALAERFSFGKVHPTLHVGELEIVPTGALHRGAYLGNIGGLGDGILGRSREQFSGFLLNLRSTCRGDEMP